MPIRCCRCSRIWGIREIGDRGLLLRPWSEAAMSHVLFCLVIGIVVDKRVGGVGGGAVEVITRERGFAQFALAATCVCACGPGPQDNPEILTDTTNARFAWICNSSACSLGMLDETPPPQHFAGAETEATYSFSRERFFHICSAIIDPDERNPVTYTGWCRVAACKTREQCPQLYENSISVRFGCYAGLCQNESADMRSEVDEFDIASLCFADIPRDRPIDQLDPEISALLDLVRSSCDSNGSNCVVPEDCRKP